MSYFGFLRSRHLQDVKLTYFQHMIVSLNCSWYLFLASTQALVHAFLPDVFTTSTSDCIRDLQVFLENVKSNSPVTL